MGETGVTGAIVAWRVNIPMAFCGFLESDQMVRTMGARDHPKGLVYVTRRRSTGASDRRRVVPSISVFYGIIDTLEVLAGSLPRRPLALVLEWAVLHRDELREDWARCSARQQPRKIAPLE